MKNFYLATAALLLAITGQSQLLHSIKKPGSTELSYLYGTIHLGDSVLLSWDDTFLDAFYSCDVMVGEIDFINENTDMSASLMEALTKSMLQPTEIKANADTVKLIHDILSTEFDSTVADGLVEMTPFWAMLLTEQMRKIKKSNFEDTLIIEEESPVEIIDTNYYAPIDLTLQYMALEDSMGVAGLETMQSQVDLITNLGNEVTWAIYYDYLKGSWGMNLLGSSPATDDIREVYLKQNLDSILSFFASPELSAEFMELAFNNRNESMRKGMIEMMSDHRSYFFAVGAGHLVGESGLINQLIKSGYIVTPVPFTFTKL